MGNCHPSKTNVNLGFASVVIAFLWVTISHVIVSCSHYLLITLYASEYVVFFVGSSRRDQTLIQELLFPDVKDNDRERRLLCV